MENEPIINYEAKRDAVIVELNNKEGYLVSIECKDKSSLLTLRITALNIIRELE